MPPIGPATPPITDDLIRLLTAEHEAGALPRLQRLWTYYRNEATAPTLSASNPAGKPRLAQEAGLPRRITGAPEAWADDRGARREVVIENDIAWRINTMVDFMLGRPLVTLSTAPAPLQSDIQRALDAIWDACGGMALLQDALLLGHIFGSVDLLVRCDGRALRRLGSLRALLDTPPERLADIIRIEVVDARRAVPVLDERDCRRLSGYIIHFRRALNRAEGDTSRPGASPQRATSEVTEVFTRASRRLLIDGRQVERDDTFPPGAIPVAHIQNVPQPLRWAGLGEVEPLIPLQDELNTRLSDRACRVTMQSFQMYLARGLDGFDQFPVGPGQIWSTDNPDASIEAFGADAASPSEEAHILEIREALDKVSGVPPLAAGVVRARIGNLSSENALRVTLLGLLTRTERKREAYGRGIRQVNAMLLGALDAAGVLCTTPDQRDTRLEWPEAVALQQREALSAAQAKRELGVSAQRILAELGYGPEGDSPPDDTA